MLSKDMNDDLEVNSPSSIPAAQFTPSATHAPILCLTLRFCRRQ
jgi:hypothetical protein